MDVYIEKYQSLMVRANDYHRKALWQEKLRLLQEALVLCDTPCFPDANERRQELYYDVAGIYRRLGQYDRAQAKLQESLDVYPDASLSFRASVLGELGVMARHNSQFHKAQEAFREQGRLARESPPSIQADAEICRAIGNEGMSTYNLWQQTKPEDPSLLSTAFSQLRERITRAQDLQQRLSKETPDSKYSAMAKSWEIIGMDRLTLCHIAANETADAVRVAEESQRRQTREDPTVTAFSKFFYGNALWCNGQQKEALEQWNAPSGTCSSPMAFCKEPGAEHNDYLKLMASAGANFDTYDEQGFSALDHAVLSDSVNAREAIPIIEEALRKGFRRDIERENPGMVHEDVQSKVDEEILVRRRQAELRRQYRTILQEQIRPELRTGGIGTFKKLRAIYARFLTEDTKERRMFSAFNFVKYRDFLKHGELPISTSGLTMKFANDNNEMDAAMDDAFIIFLSYRWIGSGVPDDNTRTQWKRMVDAIQEFLKLNPHVKSDHLGIWLDYACIDQEDEQEKARGVDALPLAVTQCNAMISLVDDIYYERAWCAVEVMLMRALVESYETHQWWEHVDGSLQKGNIKRALDVTNLKLTKEKMDRPKIDFLMRQSKILGKDKY